MGPKFRLLASTRLSLFQTQAGPLPPPNIGTRQSRITCISGRHSGLAFDFGTVAFALRYLPPHALSLFMESLSYTNSIARAGFDTGNPLDF